MSEQNKECDKRAKSSFNLYKIRTWVMFVSDFAESNSISSAAQITAKAGNGASCRPHTNPDTAKPPPRTVPKQPQAGMSTLWYKYKPCIIVTVTHWATAGRAAATKEDVAEEKRRQLHKHNLRLFLLTNCKCESEGNETAKFNFYQPCFHVATSSSFTT